MREIKFRGYAPSIGWIYGNLIEKDDPRKEIPTPWVRLIHDRALSATKVDFYSVGQFTGLHDKNGVEIYEKDITDNGLVIWHDGYLGFFLKGDFIEGNHKPLYENDLIEVIGNIYENPELMNEGTF